MEMPQALDLDDIIDTVEQDGGFIDLYGGFDAALQAFVVDKEEHVNKKGMGQNLLIFQILQELHFVFSPTPDSLGKQVATYRDQLVSMKKTSDEMYRVHWKPFIAMNAKVAMSLAHYRLVKAEAN